MELALMRSEMERAGALAVEARNTLLTGRGVPKKTYGTGWTVRADVPIDGYEGPMPMEKMEMGWGGASGENGTCPPNYPPAAPTGVCAHVAFIEIDAQMMFKQSMAYLATGDDRYAAQAIGIAMAWAKKNKVFGPKHRNGPLEAAWGCSAMARGMELLRHTWPGFKEGDLTAFLGWLDGTLMPQMEWYVNVITPNARNVKKNVYNNWHATIADCWITAGVLADDVDRFERGVALHRATVSDYFKWGRSGPYGSGRIIGESTETLRDIFHTQFAMGSMLQAAEAAWAQGQDEYSVADYALAAAMEMHARLINAQLANSDETLLPPNFR
ncbi:MAG: chondroitin AC/alginate lyase [Monoraphidium minutum]|nr:MAG: chondroitin AC/alginate lyase [Monoraphidium minutum]